MALSACQPPSKGMPRCLSVSDAALSLFGWPVGTAGARGAVERPGAVAGRFPLRLGEDAILREFVDAPPPRELSALTTPSICSERANPCVSLVAASPVEISGASVPPPMY